MLTATMTYHRCFAPLPTEPNGKHFTVGAFLNNPAFVGSTHITSSQDPAAPHDFYPGDLEKYVDQSVFFSKRD